MLTYQLGDARQRRDLPAAIDRALETVAGLAAQPQPARGARDRHRLEVGALEHDRAGGVADFRVQPAHDAGDRQRLLRVGDQQVGRLERAAARCRA